MFVISHHSPSTRARAPAPHPPSSARPSHPSESNFDLVAQFRDEFDLDQAPIQIAGKIEHMHLEQAARCRSPSAACRDSRHRRAASARCRYTRTAETPQIGDLRRMRRKFAVGNPSVAAELACRAPRARSFDSGAPAGAPRPAKSARSKRSRTAVLLTRTPSTTNGGDLLDAETPRPARLPQALDRAAGLAAVAKIIAHHHVPRAQAPRRSAHRRTPAGSSRACAR